MITEEYPVPAEIIASYYFNEHGLLYHVEGSNKVTSPFNNPVNHGMCRKSAFSLGGLSPKHQQATKSSGASPVPNILPAESRDWSADGSHIF